MLSRRRMTAGSSDRSGLQVAAKSIMPGRCRRSVTQPAFEGEPSSLSVP